MSDNCLWTIKDRPVGMAGAEFYYQRECCDKNIEAGDSEVYCGNCGKEIEDVKNELWKWLDEREGIR
jgi:hypothetical protein